MDHGGWLIFDDLVKLAIIGSWTISYDLVKLVIEEVGLGTSLGVDDRLLSDTGVCKKDIENDDSPSFFLLYS